jgi:hypothetical protein
VAITGDFEGRVDFGGTALTSPTTTGNGFPQIYGFLARYSSTGTLVYAVDFGKGVASRGSALAASGGDVLMAGAVEDAVAFGSTTLTGDPNTGSAFLARFDPTGAPRWAKLVPDSAGAVGGEPTAIALDAAGRAHITGYLGLSLVTASIDSQTGNLLGSVNASVSDAGAGLQGGSIAVDSTQSVWVSGSFDTHATVGTFTLSGNSVGVFVVRIDPGAAP